MNTRQTSSSSFKRIEDQQPQNTSTQPQPSITEVNNAMQTMMQSMAQITTQLASISTQLQNQQSTLMQINTNVSNLSQQVIELQNHNKEKDLKMCEMETKINKLEQKLMEKILEINNVTNDELSATDVMKKIATSVNVELNECDIENAYKTKRNNKVFVELCSLRKKREIMNNLNRHRIDAKKINEDNNTNGNENNNKKYIYINDQLTQNNRRLLWLTKNKAKEANWKYVWVRNGEIHARKIEKSQVVNISTENDLEMIM